MSFGRSFGIIAVSTAIVYDRHHSRTMLWHNLGRIVQDRQLAVFLIDANLFNYAEANWFMPKFCVSR